MNRSECFSSEQTKRKETSSESIDHFSLWFNSGALLLVLLIFETGDTDECISELHAGCGKLHGSLSFASLWSSRAEAHFSSLSLKNHAWAGLESMSQVFITVIKSQLAVKAIPTKSWVYHGGDSGPQGLFTCNSQLKVSRMQMNFAKSWKERSAFYWNAVTNWVFLPQFIEVSRFVDTYYWPEKTWHVLEQKWEVNEEWW